MNEYIYKSFTDKFESQKLRHDLLSDIRYPTILIMQLGIQQI